MFFSCEVFLVAEYQFRITEPRPYFAELPYYAWGSVNYDSEGDCGNPLDRKWHWMELTHRGTREQVYIGSKDEIWTVSGDEPVAARIALFLAQRCRAGWVSPKEAPNLGDWDHAKACERAMLVVRTFENKVLTPFAKGHSFWGSWKWVDLGGTEYTWVGRWIMDAVVRDDPRAVYLCVSWLRDGTVMESQSVALRYALSRLTGLAFGTDEEWVDWYEEGVELYPEPDFKAWHEDLKKIYGGMDA
jgi:hypothetical protein